ncbi:MAG: AbrB/MazE/SpoVT family DNA-binding domain-containing protein [Candidatus Hodarchaeales archaeon]
MATNNIGKVGRKGELYPPKELRETLGLHPNTKIRFYASPKGQLIIEKIITAEDLLKMAPIAKIATEKIEMTSEQMQKSK